MTGPVGHLGCGQFRCCHPNRSSITRFSFFPSDDSGGDEAGMSMIIRSPGKPCLEAFHRVPAYITVSSSDSKVNHHHRRP